MCLYEVSAQFPGGGMNQGVACCFDPSIVVTRLKDAFGEDVDVDTTEYGWKDYKYFLSIGAVEALQIAENDARRRAPIYKFRFPKHDSVCGVAERYSVRIWSEKTIPEPIKFRFLDFLHGLPLVQYEVRSVRIDGNDAE